MAAVLCPVVITNFPNANSSFSYLRNSLAHSKHDDEKNTSASRLSEGEFHGAMLGCSSFISRTPTGGVPREDAWSFFLLPHWPIRVTAGSCARTFMAQVTAANNVAEGSPLLSLSYAALAIRGSGRCLILPRLAFLTLIIRLSLLQSVLLARWSDREGITKLKNDIGMCRHFVIGKISIHIVLLQLLACTILMP